MSVLKVKDPATGEWIPVGSGGSGGSGGGSIAPLYVTIDPDTETASEPAQRIVDYIMNGGDVFLRNGTKEIAFTHTDGSSCYFTEITAEDNYVRQVIVHDDGTYEGFSYQAASKGEVNNKITAPTKAEIGQTIVVKAVDESGSPVIWECVDLKPEWKLLADISLTEDTVGIVVSTDINGEPFSCSEIAISANPISDGTNRGLSFFSSATQTHSTRVWEDRTNIITSSTEKPSMFVIYGKKLVDQAVFQLAYNPGVNDSSIYLNGKVYGAYYGRFVGEFFNIISFCAGLPNAGGVFKAGSTFKIYGR